MYLENITAVITDNLPLGGPAVTGTAAGATNNEYWWVFVILGGVIGTFGGVMLPYYKEKRKFGKEGIDLLFDRDFLKTAAGALVISVVAIGAIYSTLEANANSSASYWATFLAAATLAFTLNIGGSWIIGSNNRAAETQLIEKKANALITMRQAEQPELLNTVKKGTGDVLPKDTSSSPGPDGVIGGNDSVAQPTSA